MNSEKPAPHFDVFGVAICRNSSSLSIIFVDSVFVFRVSEEALAALSLALPGQILVSALLNPGCNVIRNHIADRGRNIHYIHLCLIVCHFFTVLYVKSQLYDTFLYGRMFFILVDMLDFSLLTWVTREISQKPGKYNKNPVLIFFGI